MGFFLKEKYFLIGVFPLFVLAIIFIFLGSYGIERSTIDLNKKILIHKDAKNKNVTGPQMVEIEQSLDQARYTRSLNLYMLICAGIMVVHALVLFEMRTKWPSAFGTITASLIVLGVMRKYNNIGVKGTNNLYIYIGTVLTFAMYVFAARGDLLGVLKSNSGSDFGEM